MADDIEALRARYREREDQLYRLIDQIPGVNAWDAIDMIRYILMPDAPRYTPPSYIHRPHLEYHGR